jgi:phosphopantothenoylcysteine decarboxylase/phosphopantothenate--cysteine ligase
MRHAVLEEFSGCTAVIMAAAVSDYRPVDFARKKIKRVRVRSNSASNRILTFSRKSVPEEWEDVGRIRCRDRGTGSQRREKTKDKNLDMIVANNVSEAGAGFDVDTNVATILDRAGTVRSLPLMSKDELAEQILDHLLVLKTSVKMGIPRDPKPAKYFVGCSPRD